MLLSRWTWPGWKVGWQQPCDVQQREIQSPVHKKKQLQTPVHAVSCPPGKYCGTKGHRGHSGHKMEFKSALCPQRKYPWQL